MIRKVKLVIILIIISIIFTSCASSRELNKLAIVTATALDIENGKILLTNEVVIPSATEPGSPVEDKVMYIQSAGDTIFEAFRHALLELDRKLYLSHNMVLVFGEEFAKRGIGDYLDFYTNDAEPRETSYMTVAKGDKGYNLLGINAGLANSSGDYIKGLIENFENNPKSKKTTVYEYFKYFYGFKTPVLGVIRKVEKIEINKKDGENTPSKTTLDVTGGTVFRGDKLIGYYTGDEMFGSSFMNNEIKGGLIVFHTPDEFIDYKNLVATSGEFASMEIISSRTKKDINLIDGQFHLDISVRLKGAIGEELQGIELTEIDTKNAIQKACSEKVEEYIRLAMDKAQKDFKIDNFQIKKLIYIKYPEIWKEISDDWDQGVFPNISYSLKVDTNLIRTGLINIPSNLEKGRKE